MQLVSRTHREEEASTGGGLRIKSYQVGTMNLLTTTATLGITVNPDACIPLVTCTTMGEAGNSSSYGGGWPTISADGKTIVVSQLVSAGAIRVVRYSLTEFENFKSLQKGSVLATMATEITVPVIPVQADSALFFFSSAVLRTISNGYAQSLPLEVKIENGMIVAVRAPTRAANEIYSGATWGLVELH